MLEHDECVFVMMIRAVLYVINEMMSAMYYYTCMCQLCIMNDGLRRCIELLNDESMHLHKYETVELYPQSDGGAFAQSDGEAY